MLQNVQSAYQFYRQTYNDAIDWSIIFEKLKFFNANRDFILTKNRDDWYGFLQYLQYIESTIPTYDFYKTGIDDHTNWASRVFKLFGRAELEERAVLESNFSKKYFLFRNPALTDIGKFHTGAGKAIADLTDALKNKYDVKHENVNFSKAHDAKYIIKYSTAGIIELHERDKIPSIIDAIQYKSLETLCDEVGINFILMNNNSTEESIENYLGINL